MIAHKNVVPEDEGGEGPAIVCMRRWECDL